MLEMDIYLSTYIFSVKLSPIYNFWLLQFRLRNCSFSSLKTTIVARVSTTL